MDQGYDANASVHKAAWPSCDEEAMKVAKLKLFFRSTARARDVLWLFRPTKEELEAFALSDAKIKELIGGKEIIKVVCVQRDW